MIMKKLINILLILSMILQCMYPLTVYEKEPQKILKTSQKAKTTIHLSKTLQTPLINKLQTPKPILLSTESKPTKITKPTEPTKTPSKTKTIPNLDIPISKSLQEHIFKLCNEDVDLYYLMIAIMEQESSFKSDSISQDGRDYGLFQIRDINFSWLKEELDIKDCIDPYNNAKCAVHMISKLIDKYEDYNLVLMAYNMGEYGAKCKWEQGMYSSSYSRAVMPKYEKYKKQAKEN